MKKLIKTLAVLALAFFITACGGSGTLKDGTYQAAGTISTRTGWTNFLEFTVEDGKIVSAVYDSVNLREGFKETKAQQAAAGTYVMNAAAGEWDVQAKKIVDYLLEHQNFDGVKFDDDSKDVDGVTGATISFGDIVDLLKAAKEAEKVAAKAAKEAAKAAKEAEKVAKAEKTATIA